jgi:hypothetical protein
MGSVGKLRRVSLIKRGHRSKETCPRSKDLLTGKELKKFEIKLEKVWGSLREKSQVRLFKHKVRREGLECCQKVNFGKFRDFLPFSFAFRKHPFFYLYS